LLRSRLLSLLGPLLLLLRSRLLSLLGPLLLLLRPGLLGPAGAAAAVVAVAAVCACLLVVAVAAVVRPAALLAAPEAWPVPFALRVCPYAGQSSRKAETGLPYLWIVRIAL